MPPHFCIPLHHKLLMKDKINSSIGGGARPEHVQWVSRIVAAVSDRRFLLCFVYLL